LIAARLHAIGDVRLHEEPVPTSNQGEALLRVTSVGICGSDLHWFMDGTTGDGDITSPFILGHEFAGVVESGKHAGRHVAVDPLVPCGRCEFCKEGNPNLCPDQIFAGHYPQDGAMREFMAWPERNFHDLPDSLTDEDGAMLEPLGVAIHTVDLGKVKPGMTIGIYGCGPIGLLAVQLVRELGAKRIIASDKLSHRIQAAQDLGATDVILYHQGEENAEILAATNNRGVDVAFEIAGDNDAAETAIETCKPGGRVVLCGISPTNRTSFVSSTARRKGLTLKMVRRMKHTYPRAIQWVESGRIDLRSLITHRFSLKESAEAFETAKRREGLKVVINP
jgi:L-iditol 2-dehydrogenase